MATVNNPWVTWIWKVSSALGLITGILSLTSLLWTLWDFGPIKAFEIMLLYYQNSLNLVLGWSDEPLRTLIRRIQEWTGIRISLSAGWKHVFVLMWLYFLSDARTNWPHRKGYSLFSVTLGGFVALCTSIAVGLETTAGPSIVTAIIPMIAMFVFELIRSLSGATFAISTPSFDASDKTWRQIFAYCFRNYSLPILIVAVAVLVTCRISYYQIFPTASVDFGLFSLSTFVVTLAVFWLGRGAYLATCDRQGVESWLHRFQRSGSTWLGLWMLATISGTALFVLLNAGLK